MLETARLEEATQELRKQRDNPSNVRRFLELIKNLAATFLFADSGEKRQIVEIALSNRRVLGKTVCLEPTNWLLTAEQAIAGLFGVPSRPTSRSRHLMPKKHVTALIEASKAVGAIKLRSVLHPANDNDAASPPSARHKFPRLH